MTNKVQKIIAYIDKLLEKYPKNYYLLTIAEFIDSLQKEEPVSIWHDASEKPNIKEKSGIFVITLLNSEYIGSRYYNYDDVTINFSNYDKWAYLNDLVNLSNAERIENDSKEEHVSEELEGAAKIYGNKKHPMTTTGANESAYDFKAGAQWQEEQLIDKAVEWLKENYKDYIIVDIDNKYEGVDSLFLEDFRNYMKDE